jgi:hypothetical protein
MLRHESSSTKVTCLTLNSERATSEFCHPLATKCLLDEVEPKISFERKKEGDK